MLDLFSKLTTFLKLENVCTDNNVFRMHYKVTAIMLVAFSLLVTSKQYFGEPIDCIPGATDIVRDTLNTYCWIHATFIVKKHLKGTTGQDVLRPGVSYHLKGDEVITQNYYQWVCFVLFLQAVAFSVPGYLWKLWEGDRIRMLAIDLGSPLLGNNWNTERKRNIVEYLVNTAVHPHTFYILRFTLCEILNFANVVGQIFLLDRFLGGEFVTLGPSFIQIAVADKRNRVSPLDRVFPKVAKCVMDRYGVAGGINTEDALCLLPLNNINEKVFLFLWFWFVALAVASALALLYRVAVLVNVRIRIYLLWARARLVPRHTADLVGRSLPAGNWFLLTQLSKNVNPSVYMELLTELALRLRQKEKIIVRA